MWIHDIVMVAGKTTHEDVHDIVFSSLPSGYGTAVEELHKENDCLREDNQALRDGLIAARIRMTWTNAVRKTLSMK